MMDTKKAFDEQLMQEPQRIIDALEALQREREVRSLYDPNCCGLQAMIFMHFMVYLGLLSSSGRSIQFR